MQRTHVNVSIGIIGAFLASVAGGPTLAGHSHSMNEHPLRGDFPTATEAAEGDTNQADQMPTAFGCEVMQGEVEEVVDGAPVIRETGDVWTCLMKQASATPALVRVFLPVPE